MEKNRFLHAPHVMLTERQVDELAQYLSGTSTSLDDALQNLFGIEWADLNDSDHAAIDERVFLCEECGWWSEVSDMSAEEQVCDECGGYLDD